MNTLSSLFLNDTVDAEIEAFCASDPEYLKTKQEFYETAEKIALRVGFDLYDAFEKSLGAYWTRASDLYYLYGLGFRQEVLRSLSAGG